MSRRSTRLHEPDPIGVSSGEEPSSVRSQTPVRKFARKSTARYAQSSDADDEPVDRRRSLRHRSPNKRYTEDFVADTRRSRRSRAPSEPEPSEDDDECVEDGHQLDELAVKVKATTLFEEREDVEGQRIYGFKTPKKRGSMSVLVSSVQHRTPTTASRVGSSSKQPTRTPKTPARGTPSTTPGRRKSLAAAKTPHRDRSKLKKNISKIVRNDSASDFSASESDFVPTSGDEDDDDDDGDNEGSSGEDSSSEEEEIAKPKRPVIKQQPAQISIASALPQARVSTRTRGRKKATELQYVLQSDDYFSTHSSSKVVTSDHTLDRLNTPRLPHDQLFRLLRELRGSSEHEKAIHELHEEYENYFAKWLYLMNEGFNILLYGLGSKRNLLQTFHRKILPNQPVIVINGFFPTLTIKDILDAITGDVLDLNVTSGNFHELVDIIEEEFSFLPRTHLFLIVHNLDGTMLRNSKTQNVLARLAKIDNIHLLASIDHINTPLIWDSSKLSYFNFSWWDVTTMLPYSDETAFENSLLVQNSGALALSSMKNVFNSLTTNSRGIFLAIVRHQLANKGNPHYPGMLFKDLYSSCREAFLVSTDLALRAQLTEFIDHKLVKVKRTVDGAENLLIPIEAGLLDQFLEENQEK
ncbi:origin recognition complex subunit 2 [Wyeomyia smithii]|uniref:origin recognition complex subunit 2 n=1 Tax=Wyeomyia smithii TaxID=174621 RepID=UPI002467BCFB|nr:origin recognition complex subunit 2 [Wyeomyia smithii]XP_055524488.1 origin recognition complex subunit 2 [Wyeomyia smithii]